eukprot:gnl/MRDRNA2_/MRDRNA2_29606_c0_seq1.p1 gnl/MRDRNA2_/MRDRNA2_29606_c0~~gnl/MRDRNA2_/MRDRNA2_29606_c0_seq1.p1  ORF type:complete len:147 (+),score=20.18 gnl/MRDRNA2_/MRDRNA2_29606_c0_seq1:65-505(+)
MADSLQAARGQFCSDPKQMKGLSEREYQYSQYLRQQGAAFYPGGSHSGIGSSIGTSSNRFERTSAPGEPRMQIHKWSTSEVPPKATSWDDSAIGEMLRSTDGGWRPPRPQFTPRYGSDALPAGNPSWRATCLGSLAHHIILRPGSE